MTKLQELIDIANKEYDGHFTLMKFTTDWGCCFGTLDNTLMTSYQMSHGKTMSESIRRCIANRTDSRIISRMENGKMIHIYDESGNTSHLFPGDEIKVIRKSGKESKGIYLGECYKYRDYGHWYFTSALHDPDDYCNYYYSDSSKKYISINEESPLKQIRIDETSIDRVIVMRHKVNKNSGNA